MSGSVLALFIKIRSLIRRRNNYGRRRMYNVYCLTFSPPAYIFSFLDDVL